MVSNLVSIHRISHPLADAINELNKNSNCWSRDMLNFSFSEKDLELFLRYILYMIFQKKNFFFMLYSLNWPNFIAWLSLFLNIFGTICVTVVCLPGCDVINFQIILIFLIKPFCYKTKKSKEKLKYLENEKSYSGEKKAFFIIFKGLSVVKNFLRPESASLKLPPYQSFFFG